MPQFRVPLGVDGIQTHLHPDVVHLVGGAVHEDRRGTVDQFPHRAPHQGVDQDVRQDVAYPPPRKSPLVRALGFGDEVPDQVCRPEGVGQVREDAQASREVAHVRAHGAQTEGIGRLEVGRIEGGAGGVGTPVIEDVLRKTEVHSHAGHVVEALRNRRVMYLITLRGRMRFDAMARYPFCHNRASRLQRPPDHLSNPRMTTQDSFMSTAEADFQNLVRETQGLQPWRRIFHAVNGVVIGLAPVLLGATRVVTVTVLAMALATALAVDLIRLRYPSLNQRFFKAFKVLASPREAAGIASSTWYLVGAVLAYGLFPMPYASAAILVLGLADPAASVVGRVFGTRRLGKGSVEGTAAFFLTAALVLFLAFPGRPAVLAAALGVALAEILPWRVDDNLTVPLVTGALLWILLGTPV